MGEMANLLAEYCNAHNGQTPTQYNHQEFINWLCGSLEEKRASLSTPQERMNIKEYRKQSVKTITGSIIDIETIGEFDINYKNSDDSREYQYLKQVILGYICGDELRIFCALNQAGITELAARTSDILHNLAKPFYAYQCAFEQGVWEHHIGIKVDFGGELQGSRHESKKTACQSLKIPNYGDPFDGDGKECITQWLSGNFKDCMAHNRACLLKERDILGLRYLRGRNE